MLFFSRSASLSSACEGKPQRWRVQGTAQHMWQRRKMHTHTKPSILATKPQTFPSKPDTRPPHPSRHHPDKAWAISYLAWENHAKGRSSKQAWETEAVPVFGRKRANEWHPHMEVTAVARYHQRHWLYDFLETFCAGLFEAKRCLGFVRVDAPTTRLSFGPFVSLIPRTVLADLMICKSENDHR